jgi:hypothetical protein
VVNAAEPIFRSIHEQPTAKEVNLPESEAIRTTPGITSRSIEDDKYENSIWNFLGVASEDSTFAAR